MILEVFYCQKWIFSYKISQIHIFGIHWVSKNMKGWLKICSLFLVYSQIWLNYPPRDRHFIFSIFLLMITTLSNKQKFLKIKLKIPIPRQNLKNQAYHRTKRFGKNSFIIIVSVFLCGECAPFWQQKKRDWNLTKDLFFGKNTHICNIWRKFLFFLGNLQIYTIVFNM